MNCAQMVGTACTDKKYNFYRSSTVTQMCRMNGKSEVNIIHVPCTLKSLKFV